jgi:hypothetical protein
VTRKKPSQRSGLFMRSPPPPPPEHIPGWDKEALEAAFRQIAADHSLPSLLATARGYVDQTGEQALKVYGRAGLPDKLGAYGRPGPDDPWEPLSIAETPSAPWQSVAHSPFPREGGFEGKHLPAIGRDAFSRDSEGGFATMVLDRVRTASFLLSRAEKNDNHEAVETFNAAVEMVLAWAMWREEFGLADCIAPTLKQRAGRAEGARLRWSRDIPRLEAERVQWQSCADEVWRDWPSLTKAAVARVVVTRLSLGHSADWVARHIKKAGRS